jgi:hypothetical protein
VVGADAAAIVPVGAAAVVAAAAIGPGAERISAAKAGVS